MLTVPLPWEKDGLEVAGFDPVRQPATEKAVAATTITVSAHLFDFSIVIILDIDF